MFKLVVKKSITIFLAYAIILPAYSAEIVVASVFTEDDKDKISSIQNVIDLKAEINSSYQQKDYRGALLLIDKYSKTAELGRELLSIQGWSYFNVNEFDKSADVFLKLYQSAPDKNSAEGLYWSYNKLGKINDLPILVKDDHLKNLIDSNYNNSNSSDGNSLLQRKFNREKYTPFADLGISNYDIYATQISRTGDQGRSRLMYRTLPRISYGIVHSVSDSSIDDFRLEVDRVTLDSGFLDAAVGPAVGTDGAYLPAIVPGIIPTSFTGYEPRFIYRHDTEPATYQIQLGTTPSGGPVSSTLIGDASVKLYSDKTTYQFQVYNNPIRESMLSFVGMVDPYASSPAWGRVTRSGIRLNLDNQFSANYNLKSSIFTEAISGIHTRRNNHSGFDFGLGYSFINQNFEYLTFDISGRYESYSNNQNLFTYGNGGYYSPQSSAHIGPSLNFLTRAFFPLVLQGRVAADYGHSSSTDALKFPLDPLSPPRVNYYSGNTSGMSKSANLQALWNIDKSIQLGVAISYNNSVASLPTFTEKGIAFFARMPFADVQR